MNITVIGAGAWGTALAISLSANHRITLWARDAVQIEAMRVTRCNQRYLPEILLPANLELSADFPAALAAAELVIIAVPTAALRQTLHQIIELPNRLSGGLNANHFDKLRTGLPHASRQDHRALCRRWPGRQLCALYGAAAG